LGAVGAAIAVVVLGVGWLGAGGLAGVIFAVGYAVLLTLALRLGSRVGPAKPIHLDHAGIWFDGSLVLPRGSIQWIELLPGSQAATTHGVGVRAFAGGIRVGKVWFEMSVPPELVQVARALGIQVKDPPSATG